MMERQYKDSGISWVGRIPKTWDVLRNKNTFICGKSYVGEKSSSTQLLSLTTKGIRAIKVGETSGKIPDSYDTYQVVKPNNLVMCLFDLDCSAVFSGISNFDGMISPAYKVLSCKKSIIPQYANYWFIYVFDGRKFMHYSKNIRYSLTYDEFSALKIVVPPIPEQQLIADYLDKKCGEIDSLIALQEQMIESLKAYKQSVITEAVTKGLDPNAKLVPSGIDWIGDIPEGWKIPKTLYTLNMPITDGPHTTPELFESGIPFVSAEAVSCGNGSIDFDHIRGFISQQFYEECCLKYIPQVGDVYMIKSGATTGKVSIVDTEKVFTIWSPLAVFRSNMNVIIPRFLFYTLQGDYYQKQISLYWTYGTQQNIGMRTLEQLLIVLPPLSEQQAIASYLDEKCADIDRLITLKQQKIESLKDYKKSVIYEAVTGKTIIES